MKHTKSARSLKNRGLVPTIEPEPALSQTCGFRKVLDNVELISNIKFPKKLMSECRDIENAPNMGLSPICEPPNILFNNRALSLLYCYGALTSFKKSEKLMDS